MPTTSNFGWTTPADTDLVKNGALAIRTLGNGIDTSMAQLKGGTTGQVLSKTSNTDMAFTWVTQDDANAIQNAIVDAKGDLIAATGNDTPARLAVGNNGETLVADSSASVGLRYQEPKAGNPVLNSSFQIWQRGTSLASGSSASVYSADRWQCVRSAFASGATISRQLTNDTTNLPFIQYSARVQRDSGNTSTNIIYLHQPLETVNSIPFAGKTVTLSFYARAGANFSSASNALTAQLIGGTGTDQNAIGVGYTGQTNIINTNVTLTTTWQRFQATATVGSSITELDINFPYTPTGTAGANDWFEITGVQLEAGSIATPYRSFSATLAGELAACQRYYQLVAANDSAGAICMGMGYSGSSFYGIIDLATEMRAIPTLSQVSGTNYFSLEGAGSEDFFDSITSLWRTGKSRIGISVTSGIAITTGYCYSCSTKNTAALVALVSEL